MPHSPGPTLFDHLREIGRELARALRTAAKRPTFSLVAIATLGIGIGASTATFSIADAVLMRPLPVHEQRKLSVLWGVDQAAGRGAGAGPVRRVQGIRGRLAEDALRRRRGRLSRRGHAFPFARERTA